MGKRDSGVHVEVTCWLVNLYCWLVIGTVVSVYVFRMFCIRHLPEIQKRHTPLLWICCASILSFSTISRPFNNFMLLYRPQSSILEALDYFIAFVCLDTAALSYMARGWLLLFDIRYALENSNKQWMVNIDPTIETNADKLWFTHRKSKLGNLNWILHRCLAVALLSLVINAVILTFDTNNGLYFVLTILVKIVLCCIYGIFIICKIPKFSDQFRVKDESMKMLQWIGFVIVVTVCQILFYRVIAVDSPIARIVGNGMGATLVGVIPLINTYWVQYRSGVIPMELRSQSILSSVRLTQLFNRVDSIEMASPKAMEVTPPVGGPKLPTLEEILSANDTFYGLMQHLCAEFSTENLLSIVEMNQFQCYCRDTLNGNASQIKILKLADLDGLQSSIVYNNDTTAVDKVCLIIEKYVNRNAPLELNLAYNTRQKLCDLYVDRSRLEAMSADEMMGIFGDTIEAVRLLMSGSYNRWKKTEQFQLIISSTVIDVPN